jgi:hypothetical protein
MVDLLVLAILSWCGWLGWQRGFFRTCLDAMSMWVPLFLLTFSIPFLKKVLIDRSWELAVSKWMAGHLVVTSPLSNGFLQVQPATPVVQGLGSHLPAVTSRFYELLLIGLMGGAMFLGVQMILRVYETLWRDVHGLWRSQLLGSVIGVGVGVTLSGYLVSFLGLVCWIQGMEWLDQGLVESVIVQVMYRGFHGFFW